MAPLISMSGMIAASIGHILASRAGAGRIRGYGVSLLSGIVVMAMLCGMTVSRRIIDVETAAISLLGFCSWWFIFFLNFVQAMESSIRVNLLREMRANGGSMSRVQLESRYSDMRLVQLRLERLVAGGAIAEREGRFTVTSPSSLRVARLFRLLKMVLLGRQSEFH